MKFSRKQLVFVSFLIIMAITSVSLVVLSSCGKEVPTMSDNTGAETTEKTPETTVNTPETEETTTAPETEPPAPPAPKYINPLTGVEVSEELSKMRPAAFMVNNIKQAIPQQGISKVDVLYECLAEGGITRLLGLVQDYKSIDTIGSIRSSRDYYLDFAQNHDALYFHAGGSDKAYSEIASRGIDNFDGVRMSIPNSFYRDPWRLSVMAYEHTLVISGEGIQNAINYRGKRTELKENFESPFKFEAEVTVPEGQDANCVFLPFSWYQQPYLKYDASTNTYKRWQYGAPHIDMNNNKQLEFTNIIVIFCHHTGALDNKGRIEVTTTGSGDGYYISNGKYIDIKYTKDTVDSPIKLFNTDGTPLEINVGKSYVAIFNQANKGEINMNYNK